MPTYRITNTATGVDLGAYEADTARAALDTMARAAGYEGIDDSCESTGGNLGELLVEEISTDLPDDIEALAAICRDALPNSADLRIEGEGDSRTIEIVADCGLAIYWDAQNQAQAGWAYECGRESGALNDTEDLGWALCDVLGLRQPQHARLEALIAEAGAAGDPEGEALARAALDGDAASIVKCARWLAGTASHTRS